MRAVQVLNILSHFVKDYDCGFVTLIQIYLLVQSNFVSATKTVVGPASNGTDVEMVKEIEVHLTEKFVQVGCFFIDSAL